MSHQQVKRKIVSMVFWKARKCFEEKEVISCVKSF